MKLIGIIPARYQSSRFPGKPLALIAGKPMIQHVVEQCRMAKSLQDVVVATDDPRIEDAVRAFCSVERTASDHLSGTDRVAEVAGRMQVDGIINIQGDEPMIDPEVIDQVAGALEDGEMSTAAVRISDEEDYKNPNAVKVVIDHRDRALYFSRSTVPFYRDGVELEITDQLKEYPFLKHLGIYGYRRDVLLNLVKLPVSGLERMERLEQLRALENGVSIQVVTVDYESISVDVPADLVRVEKILRNKI